MKLAFFDEFRLGVVVQNQIFDITEELRDVPRRGPEDLMPLLIERFADYHGRIEAVVARTPGVDLSQVRLRAPLPKPANIVCMAVNYDDGLVPSSHTNAFHKTPSAIIGPGDTMVLPDVPAIAEIFPGEERPHPWAYTLTPVRLYRKDRGRYSPSLVHDRVALEPAARVGRLKGILHHYSVRSLGDQIEKLNRYSDQQAHDLDLRGVAIPAWRVFVEFPAAFLKAYVGRRHFVRGVYGFLTAMNYAISRHMRIAKHYERRRFGVGREAPVAPERKREAG